MNCRCSAGDTGSSSPRPLCCREPPLRLSPALGPLTRQGNQPPFAGPQSFGLGTLVALLGGATAPDPALNDDAVLSILVTITERACAENNSCTEMLPPAGADVSILLPMLLIAVGAALVVRRHTSILRTPDQATSTEKTQKQR